MAAVLIADEETIYAYSDSSYKRYLRTEISSTTASIFGVILLYTFLLMVYPDYSLCHKALNVPQYQHSHSSSKVQMLYLVFRPLFCQPLNTVLHQVLP
jgi:hypothetical protein